MKSFALSQNLIGICSLFASFFIALFLIPNNVEYFPFAGISLSFLVINIFIFICIQQKTNFHKILFIFVTLTSLFIVFRANGFLTFLNILTSLYLISFYNLKNTNIVEVLISPIFAFLKSVVSVNHYKIDKNRNTVSKQNVNNNTVYPIIITIIVLALILPILASANPLFENLLASIIRSFRIEELFENLSVWILRFIAFGFLAFVIPRYIGIVNASKDEVVDSTTAFSLFIPKIVVVFVILTFFATQIQFYTATPEVLKNLGVSNSAQTRAVFTQLSVVAFIIFALIYSDKIRRYNNRIATYVLIIEGLFLTAIATYSDYSYIANWGFTHKRLYGIAIILWLFTAFALFTYKYLKEQSDNKFIANIITLTGVIILLINLVNIDFLIANFEPKGEQGIDYDYIVFSTSADGRSYDKIVDEISANTAWGGVKVPVQKIVRLKNKYSNYSPNVVLSQKFYGEFQFRKAKISDFRQLNLSEFMYVSQISDSKVDDLVAKALKIIEINKSSDQLRGENIADSSLELILVTIKLKSIEGMCNDKCIFVELKDNMELRSSSVFVGNYYKYLTKAGNYQIAIYQANEDWKRSNLLLQTTIDITENTTQIEI